MSCGQVIALHRASRLCGHLGSELSSLHFRVVRVFRGEQSELATAYYLKEELRLFWKQPSRRAAEQFLEDCCRRVMHRLVRSRPDLALVALLGIDGGELVIPMTHRDRTTNLRTTFEKIVTRANVEPWGKPFQNLRSSRETELTETHAIHLVTAWMGNTPKVAMTHYTSRGLN